MLYTYIVYISYIVHIISIYSIYHIDETLIHHQSLDGNVEISKTNTPSVFTIYNIHLISYTYIYIPYKHQTIALPEKNRKGMVFLYYLYLFANVIVICKLCMNFILVLYLLNTKLEDVRHNDANIETSSRSFQSWLGSDVHYIHDIHDILYYIYKI